MDLQKAFASLGIIEEGEKAPPVALVVLALLFPLGLAAATYFNFMGEGFALDDFILLHRVSGIDLLTNLHRLMASPRSLPYGSGSLVFWRPLGMLFFVAMRNISGLNPLPYHLANLALHGLNAALLVALVTALTRSRGVGLVAGGLFAILPTYDISVVWISQVFELLAAFFFLSTMLLFVAFIRGGHSSRLLYLGALACAVLALLSKESAVFLLPMLFPLLIALEGPRQAWQSRIENLCFLVPFAALALFFALLFSWQEANLGQGNGGYHLGSHALQNLWTYLRWMAFPFPRSWGSWVEFTGETLAVFLLAGALLAAVLRRGLIVFLVLWVLVALLPFVPFTTGIELRYTYLASLPFAALLAVLFRMVYVRISNPSSKGVSVVAGAGLFCLALLLSTQARDHQEWLRFQADVFTQLVNDAETECPGLEPQTGVFILNSPLFDPYSDRATAALNLSHEGTAVASIAGYTLPPLASMIADKCVLVYHDKRFISMNSQPGGTAAQP